MLRREESVLGEEGERACIRVYGAVEKHDIVDVYDDPLMPSRLRVLRRKIYGKGLCIVFLVDLGW